MEKVFWVKNGDLKEVNEQLRKGGKIKSIHAVSETIAAYGYAGGESCQWDHDRYVGDIYAYIVIEIN